MKCVRSLNSYSYVRKYYFVVTYSFMVKTNIAQHILGRIILLRYNLTTLALRFICRLLFDNYQTYPGADASPFVRFIRLLQSTGTNTASSPAQAIPRKAEILYVGDHKTYELSYEIEIIGRRDPLPLGKKPKERSSCVGRPTLFDTLWRFPSNQIVSRRDGNE